MAAAAGRLSAPNGGAAFVRPDGALPCPPGPGRGFFCLEKYLTVAILSHDPGRKGLASMNIYVGNLPYQTTDNDLRDLFSQVGGVISARVITDRETGKSRGFGFVEMGNAEEAHEAIQRFHGYAMDGRNLTVNEAKPRR
jgi:cold-inducible RNA-binding protein